MSTYILSYPSIAESEEKMLDDLDQILVDNGIEPRTAQSFRLAVSEAFTNALVHGNKKDSSKTIKITLKLNEDEILADISDEGQGGLGRVHNRNPIGLLDETGRGIDLIKHFATVANFREDHTGGLVVTIKLDREGE